MAIGSTLPSGYETLEDANGVTVPGGLIWTYAAGTTTPLATYTEPLCQAFNTNPIIADGAGRWTACSPPGVGYKLVFETPAIPPAHGATIKTVDNIAAPLTDATAGATGGATVISDNTSGVVNNFTLPGRSKDTLWAWNGSANLTLSGIAGAVQGDRLTIKNMSTVAGRLIGLPHSSALSTNPFYNLITITNTLLLPSGWATYVVIGTTWVMTDFNQGDYYTRGHSPTFYTASGGGSYTVPTADRDAFIASGRTMIWAVAINGTVAGIANLLTVTLPAGFSMTSSTEYSSIILTVGGASELGQVVFGGASTVLIQRLTGAAFTPGAVGFRGQIILATQ